MVRKQKRIRILPTFFLLCLIFIGLHVNATNSVKSAVDLEDTSTIIFEIESGSSAKTVASNLKSEGLIKNGYGFNQYLDKKNLDSSIQAGRYALSPSMTGIEIIETITVAGSGEIILTIIEGWTISDIDTELAEIGLIEAGSFKECTETCDFSEYTFLPGYLEGYIFPDTFFLDANTFDTKSFIGRLLDNFETKVLTEEKTIEIEESGRSLEEIITAASIIEKEVHDEEDRLIVSGILWKRLDSDWILWMCSTINYITGEAEISYEDIAIDSPYNTRQVKGLPPTPISNPGLSSINAALNPVETDYWYFLTASETGETVYSTTNDEHEVNKGNYL